MLELYRYVKFCWARNCFFEIWFSGEKTLASLHITDLLWYTSRSKTTPKPLETFQSSHWTSLSVLFNRTNIALGNLTINIFHLEIDQFIIIWIFWLQICLKELKLVVFGMKFRTKTLFDPIDPTHSIKMAWFDRFWFKRPIFYRFFSCFIQITLF